MMGCGAGGSSGQSIRLSEWEGPVTPGKHRLAMTVKIEVHDHHPDDQKKATRLHRTEVPLESAFEVLAAEPAEYIRLIDDPSMKAALHDAIQPKEIRPSRDGKGVRFVLECRNVPIGIAFDVFGRVNGREHSISAIDLAKGQSTNWQVSVDQLPQQGTFDLILRSSKKVALGTVDLFEIWQGELIYPNLPVEPAQTATSGADAPVGPRPDPNVETAQSAGFSAPAD